MPIFVVGKYYPPFNGGIEENTRDVSVGLRNRKFPVVVICCDHEKVAADDFRRGEIIDGVLVWRNFVEISIKSQPISIEAFNHVVRHTSDAIHFHAPNPWMSLAVLIRMLKRDPPRLIITHHMDMFGRPILRYFARKIYNTLLKKCSLLIVTSQKNVDVSQDIQTPCPTVAIPLGIDLGQYSLSPSERDQARAWAKSLSKGRTVVGFVGRHARYKGLDVLIQALARNPSLFGIIAGDGPYRARTEQLARELGIEERVMFLGSISHAEKVRLLAAIDVFAFPSTEVTEAFGIAQVEAMAMKAPVVASALPTGVSDVSVNGQTALTVTPGDPRELEQAIVKLVESDALRTRLVENAFASVQEKFINADNVARTVAEIEDRMRPYKANWKLPGMRPAESDGEVLLDILYEDESTYVTVPSRNVDWHRTANPVAMWRYHED